MHLKKMTLAVIACLTVWMAAAQSDTISVQPVKPVFHALTQVGILEGERETKMQLQWINGLQYKTWFGGIGVGLDYYFQRSIPLFADIRKDLSKKVPLFIYGDLGVHFPWIKKAAESGWMETEYKNGLFYEAGLGYRAQVNARNAIVVSAGYSEKALAELRKEPYIWGPPNMPQRVNRFDYRLKRISIKAGFQF